MTDDREPKAQKPVRRWIVRGAVAVVALVVVLLVGGRLLIATPPGHRIVEAIASDLPIGPPGRLSIEGVEGDPLGRVRAARLTIADADGPWLIAEDVTLDWRPLALRRRLARIESVRAERVTVLRRPAMERREDSEGSGGGSGGGWSVDVDAAALPQISLAEGVAGPAAAYAAEGAGRYSGAAEPFALDLALTRTDVEGDRLTVSAGRDAGEAVTLEAELVALAGGPLAEALGAPSQTLRARADLGGSLEAGEGGLEATLDGAPFASADGSWGSGGGAAEATIRFGAFPALADWAARLGDRATAQLTLGAVEGAARPMTLALETGTVALSAEGPINIRERTVPDGLAVNASLARPADLAPEALRQDLSAGPLEVTGRVTLTGGLRFAGVVEGEALAWNDWSAGAATAAVDVIREDGAVALAASLETAQFGAPGNVAAFVGASPRLEAVLRYSSAGRSIEVANAQLEGEAGVASGQGSLALDGLIGEGRIEIDLAENADAPVRAGRLIVQGASSRIEPDAPSRIELHLDGENLDYASQMLARLAGTAPTADFEGTLSGDAVTIDRAVLALAGLNAEARGRGSSADGWDLDVDAVLSDVPAPGPVSADGAVAIAGRLEGAFASPTVRLDARADALSAGPVALAGPRLRVELADLANEATGRATFDAAAEAGPIELTAAIGRREGALFIEDLVGVYADLRLTGEATTAGAGPQGAFSLSGQDNNLAAALDFDLGGGRSQINAAVRARDLRSGAAGRIDALNFEASGSLDEIAFSAGITGRAAAPIALELDGRFARTDAGVEVAVTPRGTAGEKIFSAPESWVFASGAGETSFQARLDVEDSQSTLLLTRAAGTTRLVADVEGLPIDLISLARPYLPLVGTLDADMDLAGEDWLAGDIQISVAGAGSADFPEVGRLDATLTASLAGEAAETRLSIDDGDTFTAYGEGDAPLRIAAWPPRPVIDREGPLALAGEAEGEIAALWALAGVPTMALSGAVDLFGSATGTINAPTLEGGGSITEGRIEEARIGLKLVNLDASARFDGRQLVVDSLSADDEAGGNVIGRGVATFGDEPGAEILAELSLDQLRAVRLPGNEVVVSGEMRFDRDQDDATLAGELVIDRADVSPPGRGNGGVTRPPVLEVIEINRPENLEPVERPRRQQIDLDVGLQADRRVFLRTQGLDSEWAFDATVRGTTTDPALSGVATLVRGEFDIAGERFEFDEAQITFDDNLADTAIDLTARREAQALTVIARITGTVSDPSISFESEPSYPEDEILSRMLFERSTTDLSALEAAQLASALSQLAGGGGFDLLGPLREGLGIDRLSLGSGEEGGALLTGGRYLSDDVYLEVGSTPTGLAEAAIEWEIRPRLEFVTRFGAGRDSTVSLRWRYDY
ncbi:MAG: translocation/assembly module TamB domain-containing protein [Maricaulaceae bacterium]|jgi:translocation and assembly module TamB